MVEKTIYFFKLLKIIFYIFSAENLKSTGDEYQIKYSNKIVNKNNIIILTKNTNITGVNV